MTPNGLLKPQYYRSGQRRLNWAPLLPFAVFCSFAVQAILPAQTAGSAAGAFVPGGRELFSTDFSQEPVGEFPKALRPLRGSMSVVEKDGKRMLRATDNAEFLISLPERLPEQFTLEFDLITREDYNTAELGFEGTPAFNRSPTSANVLWYRTDISIMGGRESGHTYLKIPADVAAELTSQPAELRADINRDTVTLYANGRQVASVPDVKFVRGRVLRIFLGGEDAKLNAVHLSRVRIADASSASPTMAQRPRPVPGTQSGNDVLVSRPVEGTPRPASTGPKVPSSAGTSPKTGDAATLIIQPTTTTGSAAGGSLPKGPNTATPALPPAAMRQRASTGPGTQTEDDVYVGRQVQGTTSPLATAPKVPPRGGTSPNTGRTTGRTTASGGGDGDLDDLEVERRKVQGITSPMATAPKVPSRGGISPNTGLTTSRTTASGGGDGDLDDLEVERRKVQGITSPISVAPKSPSGPGTAPNTGITAERGTTATPKPEAPPPK